MINRLTFLFLVSFFVIYGLIRAENFLLGPKIEIDAPQNNEVFTSSDIEIKGNARNISLLYLNGRQIFTDEKGEFKENLLLATGYNIIELKAKDKFNREIKEIRELVLK